MLRNDARLRAFYLFFFHASIRIESKAADADGSLWIHLLDGVIQFIDKCAASWKKKKKFSKTMESGCRLPLVYDTS